MFVSQSRRVPLSVEKSFPVSREEFSSHTENMSQSFGKRFRNGRERVPRQTVRGSRSVGKVSQSVGKKFRVSRKKVPSQSGKGSQSVGNSF